MDGFSPEGYVPQHFATRKKELAWFWNVLDGPVVEQLSATCSIVFFYVSFFSFIFYCSWTEGLCAPTSFSAPAAIRTTLFLNPNAAKRMA